MAFEWKFNARPYSDEEAKKLLAPVVDAETTDWHYNTHHKGYVTALNNIEKALEDGRPCSGERQLQPDRRAQAPHHLEPRRHACFTTSTGMFLAATAIRTRGRK